MDSVAFLEKSGKQPAQPIYVLHGDEDFLKRRVMLELRSRLFGTDADEFGLSTHAGDKASFATVIDELETVPFLSPCRMVVVENADPFVTEHRGALERYIAQPAKNGVLVLDVKTWPATTRLAKMLADASTIVCKAPAAYKLPEWCKKWAVARYGKQLDQNAAQLLVTLVGVDMGQLDQELAKLAVYAGSVERIEVADVDQLVGSGRTAKTFSIFDAIADKRPREALTILDQLFEQGEDPIRILGAFSYQLRRLAQIASLTQLGLPFAAAADRIGIPPFGRKSCEQQLRHLGRRRAEQLFDWLLEMDLGMKGSSSLMPRVLLERLLVRLS